MCSCSMRIRANMGLPEIVMESVAEETNGEWLDVCDYSN